MAQPKISCPMRLSTTGKRYSNNRLTFHRNVFSAAILAAKPTA
jgi:hypothetical protein